MKKTIPIVLLISIFSCVSKNEKSFDISKTEVSQKIDTTSIYNKILDELLIKYSYNKYLGVLGESLYIEYIKQEIDSVSYNKKIEKLKEQLINHDSLKGLLYINNKPFKNKKLKIKNYLHHNNYNVDYAYANKKINSSHKIAIKDFKSELVKIRLINTDSTVLEESQFKIGTLTFSDLYINEKENYGLLYFEFVCNEECGEANILLINKEGENWKIVEKYPVWEM